MLFLISITAVLPSVLFSSGGVPLPNIDTEIPAEQEEQNFNDELSKQAPPSSAGAFERISYALKVLKEGNGFKSYYSSVFDVMNNQQTVYMRSYKGNGYDLTEEWYKMYGIGASMGRNEFRTHFSDGQTIKRRLITNKNHYNIDTKTYTASYADEVKEFTLDQWFNIEKQTRLNHFPIDVTKDNINIINFDKTSDTKNYIIKFKMNLSRLPEEYLAIFKNNGGENVVINEVSLTFKISKKTGFLISYEKIEKFSASYAGLSAPCQYYTKESFEKMHTSFYPEIKALAVASFGVQI
ncbi:MAG: hypothetical protein ACOX6H_02580 [Christensenellales bacterium]|jgi:hypothetical protein